MFSSSLWSTFTLLFGQKKSQSFVSQSACTPAKVEDGKKSDKSVNDDSFNNDNCDYDDDGGINTDDKVLIWTTTTIATGSCKMTIFWLQSQ